VSEIERRIARVRARIDAALARSPRGIRPVTLIAVTKNHPAASVDEVVRSGLLDVGENRVQEAEGKAATVSTHPRWHLIGHLQRNKAARAATLFPVIHSVDSARLARALDAAGRALEVFLQVNVSGEDSKHGVAPERVRELLRACLACDRLAVLGLMTMAPYSEDPEDARPHFRALHDLRTELNRAGDGPPLTSLSMGMSGDFEVALEEGATHIRIGTAILGERSPTGG